MKKVKPDGDTLAKHLGTLLTLKTAASYGAKPPKAVDVVRAQRAAEHLVKAARDRL